MKNRFIINLFVDENGDVSRRNFSIELQEYNSSKVSEIVEKKLDLNNKKWTIEKSEEIELIEKERVIFWKAKLKKVD